MANTNLCLNSPVNLDELARCYNKTLADVLNRHAPLQTKTVTVRPLIPWFSAEIKASKKLRRKLERTWRYTGSEMDLMNYKTQKNHTNYLMSKARKNFYTNLISENSCNSKKLFNAVNKLLKPHTKSVLPDSITNKNLVNDMGSFFIQKITDIHSKIDNLLPAAENGELCEAEEIRPTVLLECFSPLTEHDVKTLITKGSKKSCPLDPMPTQLVLGCLDNLLPVLTRIINLSLELGEFPTDWKEALIFPLLKKENLDPAVFKNYRPISNLQYISKLTERVVFDQVHKHMTVNSLYPQLQSAYRKNHSTETALLKVKNYILMKMNSQHVTLLVLLDLSAAFDTVDYTILLNRLQSKVGILGKALDWFGSYLTGRKQRVSMQGTLSDRFDLKCGVPQGSCLGPLLFIIYSSKLFDIVEHHLPNIHCYADDTQLYLSFKPCSMFNQKQAVTAMENCIHDIRQWMLQDKLMINDAKTEFLVIGTQQQLSKLTISNIRVGDVTISSSIHVRNLGSWFDSRLCMDKHITSTCSASFYHIHNIRKISKYLSRDALVILIHAFITSRLDYCNSLFYGLPDSQLIKLQRVQNAAARIVYGASRWSTKVQLSYPKGKMQKTTGDRAFSSAAPHLWNQLPLEIQTAHSLAIFKSKLKTFLFKTAF